MTQRGKAFAAMTLVMALVFPLAGCASTGKAKVKRSAKQLCEAHSGTYNAQTQQCSYRAVTSSAKQTCEAQGGVYWPQEQYCEMEE
jgi:hypothetical protein